ncbi:hypothetical protein ASPZODRAFT_90182 [Penicilliopsis zonata CBS 506.65]|uniref:Glutamine amidotransferase domain-containing protein n=1 Tax=Penicilliopsis zonata CBS 506.65 TaxID=1073090 RepID=A0A1L9SSM3_9EURO|nr:hypothetical protein ASPZODRAFT_90182 [Penicilliopsis zonata CBS 506.65]OJJ50222.1 hypothetical protein ASPZODRAFT_90182 [Penicilliopsis zonata CBS 506.65]
MKTGEFPSPSNYDLVILTGGTGDIVAEKPDEWIVATMQFIRDCHAQSTCKILGICWGHQAVSRAMGGIIKEDQLGVYEIELTEAGKSFFHRESINLHKFHRRRVLSTPPGFIALAERETFLSSTGRILTLQGHPEMDESVSKLLLTNDAGFYTRDNKEQFVERIEREHDGLDVFKVIMEWAVV